ncbi:hypothetical protein ACNVED_07840 [Legionella sp. D16C41]|uniref:hypothetical protein n=1 Tax=Legionella sp. D16C41 TaxID=3402688 RepID=UPI003AF821ED
MVWATAKQEFLKQLENHLNLSLAVNNRELKNKLLDNYIVIKGRKLLRGLEGLKTILNKESHELLLCLLITATRSIETPNNENLAALKSQYQLLQQLLNETKTYNKVTTSANLFFNSIFAVSGFLASLTGFVFINTALANFTSITAGAMALAMGPWGLLALGIGIAIIGTAIAVISATEAYEDIRFLQDKQVKEIGELVSFLENPETAINEEIPEASNYLSLSSR